MEQMPLDLGIPEDPKVKVQPLEDLTDEELTLLYSSAVGINPKSRRFNRETLLAGIQNPEAEKDRLRTIDKADDDIGDPWSGK
jgi:hypothetical protein